MHGRGAFWDQFAALDVPLHSLSPRKWLPLYAVRLARLIRAHRFAIVHCHLFGANWIAKPLAAMLGAPVRINHDQCNDALRHKSVVALHLDKLANRWSSHVCAVSASTRDFLLQHEHLPAERVSVVYNGVDLRRFMPAADRVPGNRFVVLGVGRLHAQKNFRLFLDVAAALLRRGRQMSFRLAGTGPEANLLKARAVELKIAEHVEFIGHAHDMRRVYGAVDALMITSDYEGTPLTALEAMAMRVPIVTSRIDGLAEVLVDESDALLTDPGNAAGFVTRLERLMMSAELRLALADAAQRKVHAHYSAEVMAAQVEAIYDQCLARAMVQSR
jgi:glycosyltransferase involved in cell wall biosynthesis